MSSIKFDAVDVYQKYVEKFGEDSVKGTGRNWTPYRFCSEDWLLAVAVVRSTRERYDVALLACEDHQDFEPDSGLKAAISFMFADSFHRTGRMELRFRGPRKGVEPTLESGYCRGIPKKVHELAATFGAKFENRGFITNDEGRIFYCLLVGLTGSFYATLAQASIDPTRCAFLLHRGAIGLESIELIAKYSSDPLAVLEGRIVPERWLTFKRELLIMRRGLLAERIRVLYEQGAEIERELVKTEWQNSSVLSLTAPCATTLATMDITAVPPQVTVPADIKATAILCPLDDNELARFDFEALPSSVCHSRTFLIVTRDFRWMAPAVQEDFRLKAVAHKHHVIVMHETLDELDSEILARLERFATTRASIEERSE